MIKHIGTHSNKKVIILYRKVPGEDHMCLIVYPELIPRHLEAELMRIVKSPEGQAANNLAEVVFNHPMPEGIPLLAVLHKEGFIKKVNTNQTIVTPVEGSTQGSVRLDEINKIIDDLEAGSDAANKLAEMDKNTGLVSSLTKTTSASIMEGKNTAANKVNTNTASIASSGALSDEDLAKMNLDQAAQMRKNAQSLLVEAERLEKEAKSFTKKPNATKKSKITES